MDAAQWGIYNHQNDLNNQIFERNQQAAIAGAPEFQSLIDPTTGLLKDQYQMKWGGDITPDQRGIEAYRDMALGTGPSPWASAQLTQQGLEEQQQRQNAQAQGASAAAQARSAMASKYGLSPAAQERLAKSQMKNQMAGLQNVGLAGAQARAQIGSQDAANRLGFLQGLPGQENALAQIGLQNRQGAFNVQNQNLANTFAQKGAADTAAMERYKQQMADYGSGMSANAMQQQPDAK